MIHERAEMIMRATMTLIPGALIPALLMTGCGASEQGLKTAYREKFVANCVTSATRAIPAAMRVAGTEAANKVCGCTADKVMAETPATALASIAPARVMSAGRACAVQLYPNAGRRLRG